MVPEFMRKKSSYMDLQNTSRFERDYVKPVKSISETLHTHDILYGGDQNKRKFFTFCNKSHAILENIDFCFLLTNVLFVRVKSIMKKYSLNTILDNTVTTPHSSGTLILSMNLQLLDMYFIWCYLTIQNSFLLTSK